MSSTFGGGRSFLMDSCIYTRSTVLSPIESFNKARQYIEQQLASLGQWTHIKAWLLHMGQNIIVQIQEGVKSMGADFQATKSAFPPFPLPLL